MKVFDFKEFHENSMWIPDSDGHYEFDWYGEGEPRKMRLSHRIRMAWRMLVRGRIDWGDRSKAKKTVW
jgi:hypothetical protein